MPEPGYDPQKRREYYLKTRELKGREPGQEDNADDSAVIKVSGSSGSSGQRRGPKPVSQMIRSERAQQLQRLQDKLKQLRDLIRRLVIEAKESSGGDAKALRSRGKTKADSDKKSGSDKPLTAKEKAEAAKRYEKNKKAKPVGDAAKIKDLNEKILKAEKRIRDLKAKAAERRSKNGRTTKRNSKRS